MAAKPEVFYLCNCDSQDENSDGKSRICDYGETESSKRVFPGDCDKHQQTATWPSKPEVTISVEL